MSGPRQAGDTAGLGRAGSADVAVVGAGVVGAATALALARRESRVTLVERFPLADARGSSAGTARIYAPAAYPDESYLDMALRALERWRELERESGQALLERTGALAYGGFAEREMPALEAAGVTARFVTPAEAVRDFGVHVVDDAPLLYQPDAGVIRADRARRALLDLAVAAGVEAIDRVRVRSIADDGDALALDTDRGRLRCSAAVVAAGPWTKELLAAAEAAVPLSVSCQTVAYFRLGDPASRPVALIGFEGDEPYALWDPARGLKAALHARGPSVDDPDRVPEADEAAVGSVADWAGRCFDAIAGGPTAVETCLYTNTPDERFVVERRERIVVASACNGHGFQFAPETGERAARLAAEAAELRPARRRPTPR